MHAPIVYSLRQKVLLNHVFESIVCSCPGLFAENPLIFCSLNNVQFDHQAKVWRIVYDQRITATKATLWQAKTISVSCNRNWSIQSGMPSGASRQSIKPCSKKAIPSAVICQNGVLNSRQPSAARLGATASVKALADNGCCRASPQRIPPRKDKITAL